MSARLRILHVVPSLGMGGAERLLVDIITNSSSDLFEHAVLYLAEPSNYAGALTERVRSLENLEWRGRTDWPRVARRIAQVAEDFGAQIIQSAMFEANIAARLSFLFGARARFVTNVVSLDYAPETIRVTGWNPRRVALRRALDFSTAMLASTEFVACSRCVANSTINDLHIPSRRVRTIYNGVDPQTLNFEPHEALALRDLNGIPRDAFVYLNVSRLVPAKGQDIAIRAFASLASEQPRSFLALVGGGVEEPALRALAAGLGMEGRVKFVGRPERIGPSLGMGDAFVFPSLVEGLPLSLIEAMLVGVPCIASGIAPHQELIEPGSSGLLFVSGNPASLANHMREIFASPDRRAMFASAGRTRVASKFVSSNIVAQWSAFYRELASGALRCG